MPKTDLKKDLKHLYFPSAKEVSVVEVAEMNFLMVDGAGDPNTTQDFQQAIEVLYALSYTLKFTIKKLGSAPDHTVMPLEALWWTDESGRLNVEDKTSWKWTAMIVQPPSVTEGLLAEAANQVREKRNPAGLSKVRFEPFNEGLSAQIMHVGPYSEERPTIERLHRFIEDNGYVLVGKHHEIYLGDPRRTAPERLKTVVRQPIAKAR